MNTGNGSGLGKFQAAMQILLDSRLNCTNSIAYGYPIGIIIDGEKGDTPLQAQNGGLKLHHVRMVEDDIVGSDANKLYKDELVVGFGADNKPQTDALKSSFSSTWFKSQPGNAVDMFSAW